MTAHNCHSGTFLRERSQIIGIRFGIWATELDPCSPYSTGNSSTISNRTPITELDFKSDSYHRALFVLKFVLDHLVTIGFVELALVPSRDQSSSVCFRA